MELLPFIQKFGTVDLFLSGANSTLPLDAPVKYRSNGLSLFYTCKGSLDYWKLTRSISPLRIMKEARDLPVEKYDLVLNDFECITSIACARKRCPPSTLDIRPASCPIKRHALKSPIKWVNGSSRTMPALHNM
ncbi:hypothetical protein [Paraflavitalea speifideaquila]|uniref:hypothetical protein n=1 Tax=Paraflavitalea speifideaquila TaxID=3076558 RepID=UPI0028F02F81|nr:hypothetical protein [Paraflavitalea speifideiaquila]